MDLPYSVERVAFHPGRRFFIVREGFMSGHRSQMHRKTGNIYILLGVVLTIFFQACIEEIRAEERSIVSLKEFTSMEMRQQGFTIPNNMRVHIYARGGGISDRNSWDETERMFAYGWIIDASTRNVVWEMTYDNSHREGNYRISDQYIDLNKGSYEAYFCNYGYYVDAALSKSLMNIDRRQLNDEYGRQRSHNRWMWFFHLFGIGDHSWRKEWEEQARNYGMEIYVQSSEVNSVRNFIPPQQLDNTVMAITGIGDGAHVEKGFHLSKAVRFRIYAIGEGREHEEMFDYGWIIETESRKRVWEMTSDRCEHAGGAIKNMKIDETLTLPSGDYVVTFVTDDSHSPADWNSPPPSDPLMYGITLTILKDTEKNAFSLKEVKENRNIIAQLIHVHDDQTLSAGFILKSEEHIRIYAIGERSNSPEKMADYAWIVNAKDRQRVWTMESKKTLHAGGASKNRMVDEVITLPRGKYILYYRTDDSHAYGEWNDDPPSDAEHYGVTIYGNGEWFDPSKVSAVEPISPFLAQLTQMRDDEHRTSSFTLQKPARIHIYALGEGSDHELSDYGWIEDIRSGKVVWEMTYAMTTHAGGARKNRMVNTTFLLDKGEYQVHYKTDDSHSFEDWNDDPPDDPEAWGITITREE